MEALLQIHSCFLSHRIKLHGLSHCIQLPGKMSAFNRHMQQNAYYRCNLKWTSEDLSPCYCYAITTNSTTTISRLSQPPLQAKERAWVNCKLITAQYQSCEPGSFFILGISTSFGEIWEFEESTDFLGKLNVFGINLGKVVVMRFPLWSCVSLWCENQVVI